MMGNLESPVLRSVESNFSMSDGMPTFTYTVTFAGETKKTELRKSNPQGWLPDAVRATFPDLAARRAADVRRIRLNKVNGAKQTWDAVLVDEISDVMIQVTQTGA